MDRLCPRFSTVRVKVVLCSLLTFDDSVLVLGLGLGEVSPVLVSAAVLVGEGLGRDLLLVVGGGGGVVRSGGVSGGGGGVGGHGHGGGGQGAGDKQGGDKGLRWSHYIVLLMLHVKTGPASTFTFIF